MNRFGKIKQDIPLCKFGPGGDYVSSWSAPEPSKPQEEHSPLGKVLNLIAEILGAAVQPEILTEIACALPTEPLNPQTASREKTKNEPAYSHNTPPASYTPSGKTVCTEAMLFSDDWGIGCGPAHQSGHRIRTRRRTSRKRPSGTFNRQGTLFDTHTGRRSAAPAGSAV